MRTDERVYAGEIVVTTCWCGIRHGVPRELYDYVNGQHNDGVRQMGIYCPLGHSWVFSGKGEADRLREENARLERVAASRAESLRIAREDRDHADRRRAAAKGQLTKVRNRIANGVCPSCNRHFANVERHMSSQHPDFVVPLVSVGEAEK
jgi:hypothetical protein